MTRYGKYSPEASCSIYGVGVEFCTHSAHAVRKAVPTLSIAERRCGVENGKVPRHSRGIQDVDFAMSRDVEIGPPVAPWEDAARTEYLDDHGRDVRLGPMQAPHLSLIHPAEPYLEREQRSSASL